MKTITSFITKFPIFSPLALGLLGFFFFTPPLPSHLTLFHKFGNKLEAYVVFISTQNVARNPIFLGNFIGEGF